MLIGACNPMVRPIHISGPTVKLAGTDRCLSLGGGAPKYPSNALAVAAPCTALATGTTQLWQDGAAAAAGSPGRSLVKACARISSFKPDGQPPQGYCLIVDATGHWFISQGGTKGAGSRDQVNVLATGVIPNNGNANVTGTWLDLKLVVKGTTITGSVNGAVHLTWA